MKRITLILTALGALLLVSAAPASADPPHSFLGNFGSVAAGGTGSEPTFTEPAGMAVDPATGDLLAINLDSQTVERFKPDGTSDPFADLGTNVIDGKGGGFGPGSGGSCVPVSLECDETFVNLGILSTAEENPSEAQIAVAPPGAAGGTAGNIYVTDANNGIVDVFSSAGEYLTQFSGGGTFPCGVAVAPNGNVFVGDYVANKVFKLVPSGPSSYSKTGEFTTTTPCQVAAAEGFVFAAEFEGEVTKIDSEGAEEGLTKYTVDSGANLTLNVDPFDEHLYTGAANGALTKVNEYDVSGVSSATLIEPSIEPGSIVNGVAIDETSGNVYVRRFGNTKIEVYEPREPRVTPDYPLNLSTSGGEGGTFQCDTGSGPETCLAEYEEGTVVTVTTTPNAGSTFSEWSGDCTGSGACEVTMSGEMSVVAHFSLASEPFEVEQIGSNGTVECEDNGGGLGACAASYLYGHTIKVVATPESVEYVVGALTGTGSAAGNCDKETGVCEFVIEAASKVTAKFESAGKKDEAPVYVHGEVPITTTLESACSDVDLGKFIPGVTWDYTNTCGLTLTSTGAATSLTAEDESGTNTGHLVQGSYFLPSVLKSKATDSEAKGTSTGLVSLNESPGAVTLLTFAEPIAKDASTLEFSQHIDDNDGLHTGVYAKTITLTLEQTTP